MKRILYISKGNISKRKLEKNGRVSGTMGENDGEGGGGGLLDANDT